jgi:hypothetical protein
MSTPYRDQTVQCPSCKSPLRAFQTRWVCDSCNGMQLELTDLKRSLEDLTCAATELHWNGDAAGRGCPRCTVPMVTSTLDVQWDDYRISSQQGYPRCAEHGAWFDDQELAQLLLLVERRVNKGPSAGGATFSSRNKDLERLTFLRTPRPPAR